MKRSTWILVGVFVLLAAVWLVRSRKPTASAPPALDILGYVGHVSEQEARSKAKDTPAPVTRIVVHRKDEKFVLERTEAGKPGKPAEGDKPAEAAVEAKWKATRTHNGKSTEAKAQAFRAQSMSETLQRTIRSTFAQEVKPEQLSDFGLDAAHAIEVELTLPERTVKLRIGQLDKGQDIDSSNTWVQDPARGGVAYQVAGRDLRTSFDVAWADLRDRSVLTLELAAVDHVTISNPADAKAKQVAFARTPLNEQELKDLAAKKTGRDPGIGWQVVQPAGVRAGDVGDWLRNLERLSAEEFLDAADVAAKKLDTGLQDAAAATRIVLSAGGKDTTIVFGKQDDKKRFFATVGDLDEVLLVPAYAHDQAVQTLDQLRDRRLLGDKPSADVRGFVMHGPGVDLAAQRTAGSWAVTRPAMAPSQLAINNWLVELDGIKVDFADAATPTTAGLDAPDARLDLEWPAGTQSVWLGKEVDGNTWGRLKWPDGKVETFKLSSWNAKRLLKTPVDFQDKKLLHVDAAAVTDLWLKPATGEVVHVTKAAGTPAPAGSPWQFTAGSESGAANADVVQGLISTMTGTDWTAAYADKKPAAVGLAAGAKGVAGVRLRIASGAEAEVRISEQKSGENFFVAVSEKGRAERVVAIPAMAAGNLRKNLEDLKK